MLKVEFQSKLVKPRLITRRGHLSARREIRAAARRAEARRVRQVEHLRAKIETLRFGHPEILDQRHIELYQFIPAQDVAACVAIRKVRRQHKAVCLVRLQRLTGRIRGREVPATERFWLDRASNQVGPLAANTAPITCTPKFAR